MTLADQIMPENGSLSLNSVGVFHGPNLYAQDRVVVGELTLSENLGRYADDLIARVSDQFPALDLPGQLHAPESEEDALADFAVRWAAAALSQASLLLHTFGFRRVSDNVFHIWIGFERPDVSYLGLSLATNALDNAAQAQTVPDAINKRLVYLRDACMKYHPGIQGRIILSAAQSRNIPVDDAWGLSAFGQLGWGARSELLMSCTSQRDGFVGAGIIDNKLRTKHVLRQLGLPTPDFAIVDQAEELEDAIATVGFPCVIKPVDQHGGAGVSTQVSTLEQAQSAIALARTFSRRRIMMEAFMEGDDHRLVFADGKFRGAIRKTVPAVTGDGVHTIKELTEILNRDRVPYYKLDLTNLVQVTMGKAFEAHLARQGLTPDAVPATGQKVILQGISNQSAGGDFADVTSLVHPHIRMAAQSLAKTLGANVVGFDYMTTDISQSWHDIPGGFIEINLSPGLTNFTKTGWGEIETGNFVIGANTGRIPLQIVIVPDDTLDDAYRHVASLIVDTSTGVASHNRAQVGTLALDVKQSGPWTGVKMLLGNRKVERLVVLAGNANVQRHGLPVDEADTIWQCDENMPAQWHEVLKRSSNAPVRTCTFDAFKDEFRFERPA